MSEPEKKWTDREFCDHWRIDRATSLRWREQGIVGYIKLPNGQIRYRQSHIDELEARCESAALQNSKHAVKGRVVNIGVAKGRRDI